MHRLRTLVALIALAAGTATMQVVTAPVAQAATERWILHNVNTNGSPSNDFTWDVPDTCVPMTGDWDGNTHDTVGAACRNGAEWAWGLNNTHSSNATPPDRGYLFNWGSSGCLPTTGDWNGDGRRTPGIVCLRNGEWQWSMRNANAPGGVDIGPFVWHHANACWPIVGDWNGDGRDTPGVVCPRGAEWQWRLHDTNGPGGTEHAFGWGSTTCGPHFGDWNGDRRDTPGIVCDAGNEWHWRLHDHNLAGGVEHDFRFGSTSRKPITGDWNGDGRETPGLTTLGAAGATPPPGHACPVRGSVSFTDTFGAPRPDGRTHEGEDMFATAGTPTVAVTGGVTFQVENTDNDIGGISLWIRGDDGNEYYYAHHRSNAVTANGVRVGTGQVVGYVGNTGNAAGTPSHLHFEIHPGGGAPTRPYPFIHAWCQGHG
jgi:hypothetical protein